MCRPQTVLQDIPSLPTLDMGPAVCAEDAERRAILDVPSEVSTGRVIHTSDSLLLVFRNRAKRAPGRCTAKERDTATQAPVEDSTKAGFHVIKEESV